MTRKSPAAGRGSFVQGEPTKPRSIDAFGHELDEWGLPYSGPVRRQRLAELGRPDPNLEPEAWASAGTGAAPAAPVAPEQPAMTEENNG